MARKQHALRRFFETSGRTQVELAEFCGVEQPTVHRWVYGRVPDAQLERVAKFTGIPPAKLRPDLAKLFQGGCPSCEA